MTDQFKTITFEHLNSQTVYSGKAFNVDKEELRLPDGRSVVREIVRHPGAVVIMPEVRPGTFLLVRQYRAATKKALLEFPAGTLEQGEDPLSCAKREIAEEVGHRAEDWTPLGTGYPAPGFCDEIHHYFLAKDLAPHKLEADDDELFEIEELTITEIERLIATEEIVDCKTIAAMLKARVKGKI